MNRVSKIDLKVLNVLMRKHDFVSSKELQKIIGCDRKCIYAAIDNLEINGFGIEIKKYANGNKGFLCHYRYTGNIYGF